MEINLRVQTLDGSGIRAKEAVVSMDSEKFEPGLEEEQKEIRGKINVDTKIDLV